MPRSRRSRSSSRFSKVSSNWSSPKIVRKRKRSSPNVRMGWTTNNNKRIKRLERMIETKEGCIKAESGHPLPHNNVSVLFNSVGAVFNPLFSQYGTEDPMGPNDARRIGDKITVRGLLIKAFMENSLSRPKVWFRFMIIRAAKGDTIDRTTLFKNDSANKMIDQVNTERFTIVAQKTFTISAGNAAPTAANLSGVPTGTTGGGNPTKVFKMWIPGYKFGRGGNVVYENGSSQPKFFDYRLVFVAYDWYGTPQDINNVGMVNELYSKLYYKDA